jgi:iron complex outermembrane receptor protein
MQYDYQQNNRLEFDVRRADNKNKASVDLVLKTHSFKADVNTDVSDKLEYTYGVSANYQTNFANPQTGVRRLIPDYTKYSFGGFITGNYALNSQWLLEAGFRVDHTFMDVYKFYRRSFWEERGYDSEFSDLVIEQAGNQLLTNPKLHFTNPAFTLGVKHTFGTSVLFANYCLASRAPDASELFSEGLHHSASRIEIGDLQFASETAHKVSLTLQQRAEKFEFTIMPYSNFIDNYILIEPTKIRQTIRGNFQVWEYRQTQAQILGIDIDGSLSLFDNVSFKHQFSLIKGYDISQKQPLISMPSASTNNSLVYTNLKYHNLNVSLESNYVFAQNEFPDNNFEVVLQEVTQTVDISTPPPSYHLLNFRASVSMLQGLDIGLFVNNMLDTSYRNYLNRMRYYADDVGRNITLQLTYNY